MTTIISPDARWSRRRSEKQRRLEQVRAIADGVVLPTDKIVAALEALILPGDRVVLEGNNQKQADFLSCSLAKADPARLHDLHMIMPSVGRSEHLDLFERGIARKLDFSFAGTQSLRISQLLEDGLLEIGAIHTYIELYARLVVDLIPNVVLSAGFMADRAGNIYTGPSTEDTPALIEPAAFSDGIVIVQVNQLVDDVSELPRVDIPASWVDFVVVADKPFYIEPLFTRDPRHIKPVHVLMAMMAIRGIYEKHSVQSLNHGIGFNTAAIELILPTYGESLGLKGKICRNWTLNPHPTLIPAIESGWVDSVHCFGTELGMENYIAARPDVHVDFVLVGFVHGLALDVTDLDENINSHVFSLCGTCHDVDSASVAAARGPGDLARPVAAAAGLSRLWVRRPWRTAVWIPGATTRSALRAGSAGAGRTSSCSSRGCLRLPRPPPLPRPVGAGPWWFRWSAPGHRRRS